MEFDQTLVNSLFAIIFTLVGWFSRMMWRAVSDMQKEIKEVRIHMAQDYATKDEVRDALKEVKQVCERIFDKLDGKADKG